MNVSYFIKASFYYRADCFLERNLNVNFYSNPLLINSKVLFYLIPDRSERSIFYLTFDENDRIIQSSNSEFKSIVDDRYNIDSYIGRSIREFREERCIGYSNSSQYLELGELSLKEDYYLDESMTVDVRSKGYLKEANAESYYKRQHKGLQSIHGYGEEGQTVQKNNLIYIRYPIDLLDSYGGQYKEKELERYSRRKLQAGVDFIIEYEYPKSHLTFRSIQGEIEITMSWEGPGRYRLYRSLNEFSEELNEDNEVIILHEVESLNKENLIFIDDTIEANTTYWYSVRVDSYPKGNRYSVRSK